MTDAVLARSAAAAPARTKPFARFEWTLALRYLRARRARGFVSVIAGFSFLGIMLGVATLIVVMSVMNGFHKELLDKIVGVNGHIFVQSADAPMKDYDAMTERIRKVKGVAMALPMIEGAAGVSSPFGQSGALVRGVREADLEKLPGVAGNIKTGEIFGFDKVDEDHPASVVIGRRMADKLSVRVGDTISILTARGATTPFGVAPRIKAYPVRAIFSMGMAEFDGVFVYMPLSEAQAYFNRDGDVSVIEVFLDNPEKIDEMRKKIEQAAGRAVILTDWRQANETFFNALKVERNVMFIILTLIVLVAALNIISGLIMLVRDKSHDIAILRTMGATRFSVMRVFLITGASIGVAGVIAGAILGLVLAHNLEAIRTMLNRLLHADLFPAEIYFLSHLPSVVDPREVVAVVVMTLVLSIMASLYPAWRAASLDPVEALRYE
ncbi:MAG: lipoprotein-releasing ABC transporter permease subunit [Rhodoblastus sp.]